VDPCVALNFPVTHVVHVPPSGPVDPLLHLQSDTDEIPAGEFEFVGHEPLHVEMEMAPDSAEYVPALQSVHTADPVEVFAFSPLKKLKSAIPFILVSTEDGPRIVSSSKKYAQDVKPEQMPEGLKTLYEERISIQE
jgi:hypothetical protein